MKRLIIALLAGVTGIASMLAGLGIDAWLHAADPTLAEREGIFTLRNPGHALLGIGVLLATGGILSALHVAWGMARPSGVAGVPQVRLLSMGASAVAAIAAMAFAMSVSASSHEHADASVDGHKHADASVDGHKHADGAMHSHASDMPSEQASVAAVDIATDRSTNVNGGAAAEPAHSHDDALSGGPDDAPAPSDDSGHDHPLGAGSSEVPAVVPGEHRHGAVDATAEEIACGNDLVRRTQEATARFADYEVAVAEGYRSNPAKPNATHYGNRAYRLDGEVMDLARPESLIYFTNPQTGEKALIGALFVMPRGQSGPQPCGAVTYWHTHAACTNVATRESIPVDHGDACAEGYRYGESAEMMHVWFVPGRKNGVAPVL